MPYTDWAALNQRIVEQRLEWHQVREPLLVILAELDSLRRLGEIPEGKYRQKGNYFRDTIIALEARCAIRLVERRIEGMTDIHNVDLCHLQPRAEGNLSVAVFAGEVKAVFAGEVKAMGSPSHRRGEIDYPERSLGIDIDKRSKEVKYTPIDLKRKNTQGPIGAWEEWLDRTRPFFCSAWLLRLAQNDSLPRILRKLRGIADYNNGVGAAIFRQAARGDYEWIHFHAPHPRLGDIGALIETMCRPQNLK